MRKGKRILVMILTLSMLLTTVSAFLSVPVKAEGEWDFTKLFVDAEE